MNKRFFTALALAAAMLIGGPAFGNSRGGDGGRGASYSGGGRGTSFSGSARGASFSGGGSRGGYRGGSIAFGGSGRGYGRGGYGYGHGYGYGRGYGGYGFVYPYYYGDYPVYGYGYAEPVYSDNGSDYSDSNASAPVSVQVQQELARQGYYRGPIDGIVGPGTQAAISAYQRDNGLRVTGTINGKLLDALDLD